MAKEAEKLFILFSLSEVYKAYFPHIIGSCGISVGSQTNLIRKSFFFFFLLICLFKLVSIMQYIS